MANGGIAYTQHASGPQCEPVDIDTPTPPPEEIARQKEELRQWREGRKQAAREANQRRQNAAKSAGLKNREPVPVPPIPPALPGLVAPALESMTPKINE